jgi:hypothetical protein
MVRLLGLLVALILVLAVIGYFRGWFHASAQNINGHETVTVTVDKAQLNQDKAGAVQKVQALEPK